MNLFSIQWHAMHGITFSDANHHCILISSTELRYRSVLDTVSEPLERYYQLVDHALIS
jgi:hypothetical protein